jgi:hypothetical protein
MDDIRPINTKLCTPQEVQKEFKDYMLKAELEGVNLRFEKITSIRGARFVIVFDFDDMG